MRRRSKALLLTASLCLSGCSHGAGNSVVGTWHSLPDRSDAVLLIQSDGTWVLQTCGQPSATGSYSSTQSDPFKITNSVAKFHSCADGGNPLDGTIVADTLGSTDSSLSSTGAGVQLTLYGSDGSPVGRWQQQK